MIRRKIFGILGFSLFLTLVGSESFALSICGGEDISEYISALSFAKSDEYSVLCASSIYNGESFSVYAKNNKDCAFASSLSKYSTLFDIYCSENSKKFIDNTLSYSSKGSFYNASVADYDLRQMSILSTGVADVITSNSSKISVDQSHIVTIRSSSNAINLKDKSSLKMSDSSVYVFGGAKTSGLVFTGDSSADISGSYVETINSGSPILQRGDASSISIKDSEMLSHGTSSPVLNLNNKVVAEKITAKAEKSEISNIEGAGELSIDYSTLETSGYENTVADKSGIKRAFLIYRSGNISSDGSCVSTNESNVFNVDDGHECLGSDVNSKVMISNSKITNNVDNLFYITNTITEIDLYNNEIIQGDDTNFLVMKAGSWGIKGLNGGEATVKLSNQDMHGNIVLDEYSRLELDLSEGSYYRGVINATNEASLVNINISENSVIVLEGDSYINSIKNSNVNYSNVYSNGYQLFVNGESIDLNNDTPPDNADTAGSKTDDDDDCTGECCTAVCFLGVNIYIWVIIVASMLIVGLVIGVVLSHKNEEKKAKIAEERRLHAINVFNDTVQRSRGVANETQRNDNKNNSDNAQNPGSVLPVSNDDSEHIGMASSGLIDFNKVDEKYDEKKAAPKKMRDYDTEEGYEFNPYDNMKNNTEDQERDS